MKTTKIFIVLVLTLSLALAKANTNTNYSKSDTAVTNDSLRITDFEGYAAGYHEDAVVVFTTGKNKTSVSISKALANWKPGFIDTKAGKTVNNVTFRFAQRVGSETTAHETMEYQKTKATEQEWNLLE